MEPSIYIFVFCILLLFLLRFKSFLKFLFLLHFVCESSVGYVDRRCILCLASLFTSCIVSFDMWKFKFLIIDEFMDFFPLWFVNFTSSLRNYDYCMNSQLFHHHALSLSFFPPEVCIETSDIFHGPISI